MQQKMMNCIFLDGLQVASYEFTTLTCIPGVITYRGAKIQVPITLQNY